jgi:creatinine amidohydrolase
VDDDSGLHLEHMTSPAVAAALAAGRTTVVFACGAVEQHGPHLPLFTDAEHGTRLAGEVARRLGGTLVAPTVRVGCSEHHMGFAGTLTLRPETFEAVVHDYCTSLARHGFRRIGVIPTHGGNFAPLAAMLPRLGTAVGRDCTVAAYTDLKEVMRVWRDVIEAEAGLGDRVGGHADIAESAIMAALHPHLIDADRAETGLMVAMTDELLGRIFRDGFRSVTPNGILGDARGYTPALGEKCIAALADRVAAVLGAAFDALSHDAPAA